MTTSLETKPQQQSATVGGVACQQPIEQADAKVLGFKWLAAIFSPAPFLIGALIGFTTCCVLGYLTTLKNQYGNIPRFGVYVGPQASLFPTASQLLAYTQAHVKQGQILVVVGGSSVMNGVGQSNEQIWTKKLQEKLGAKYAVVNLAMRSCSTFEAALFIAEAMSKHYEKVIFVSGTQPGFEWSLIGRPPYAHYYWDAKYHNMLYEFPERDQAMENCEQHLSDYNWTPETLRELKLGEWLNSHLYTYELWNTVGYRYFFTSYSAVAAGATSMNGVYSPRKRLPTNMEAEEVFPMPNEEFAKKFFPAVLADLILWNDKTKQWEKREKRWTAALETIRTNLAPQMRPRSVIVLSYYNPVFRKKYLTKLQQESERLSYSEAEDMFHREGVHAIRSGDKYQAADFRDPIHLSASGGEKLATDVSLEVQNLAKELGYEK